ncbi:hypothetical protein HAX54_038691 [Datura stramonium]|uniref:Uncharacterized protein n=1 Tax=Datura stramonium TaxID=4076 RepID=A0ABS8RMT3_DATST|nr:hypothetical protein [Datura stramonium]
MLCMEREETQKLKKGKQTIKDTSLTHMDTALRKASGQVDCANLAVKRLENENSITAANLTFSASQEKYPPATLFLFFFRHFFSLFTNSEQYVVDFDALNLQASICGIISASSSSSFRYQVATRQRTRTSL